jgi:hypothetical protein
MAMFEMETRTRAGRCPTHGEVAGQKTVHKLSFPFFITGLLRAVAAFKRYRCPSCGAPTT